jgi:ADP-ribosyl-[dinitrogen reductase] hydrolase
VEDLRNRATGAILGLAVGDAFGAPFVSRRAGEIPSPIPALELPWLGLPPGTWTGTTAMARNLWMSLIERVGTLELNDVLGRHLAWLRSLPARVDKQTSLALIEAERGTPQAARAVFERRGPEVSAGNGSVAYCAPLGVVRALEPSRLAEEAPALSAITHWDQRCRSACLAVALTAAALVRGEPNAEAVIEAVEAVGAREGGEELQHLVDAVGTTRPIDGPDQGFTLFCAAVGLQVVGGQMGFEEGLRAVVALGGDTAANAAVAGALLGAGHGADAIPRAWLGRLAEAGDLASEAASLASLI